MRIIGKDGQADYKAFGKKADAEDRFLAGWNDLLGVDGASATLFEIPDPVTAAAAIHAVEIGRSDVLLVEKQPLLSELDLETEIDL